METKSIECEVEDAFVLFTVLEQGPPYYALSGDFGNRTAKEASFFQGKAQQNKRFSTTANTQFYPANIFSA